MPINRHIIKSLEEWNLSRPLSVIGATGSGKSSTLIKFLKENPALIEKTLLVSVDAVAVYNGLDIGSAKPLGADREQFKWTGLDLFEPSQKVNVADYLCLVEKDIVAALLRKDHIVFIGGSHFYERALVIGQSVGVESDPGFQYSLQDLSDDQLHKRLCLRDSRFGQKIHPNDRYRMTRFLDLAERQNLSYDEIFSPPKRFGELGLLGNDVDCLVKGLNLDQEQVWLNLKNRIDEMFSQGWLDEVKNLMSRFGADCPGLQSVGYREVVLYLKGELSLEECRSQVFIAHRQLAKKQRTWLRGLLSSLDSFN